MALRSNLSVYCYLLTPQVYVRDYTREVEALSFTTVAPGGFGQLTATIKVSNPRLPRPELQLFARIVVMSGFDCLFLGEISDAPLSGAQDKEQYQITALGIGNSLRDDPLSVTYAAQTALQIVTDQITQHNRPNFLPIDQDVSAVFPDNPAGTNSPSYGMKTIEEVISDQAILAGDYEWGVWDHPQNKDATNEFPTGQLVVKARDKTTMHYQATLATGEIGPDWSVTPSGDRCYNVVEIAYNDPTQATPVGVASYIDSRLGAGGVQGTAPFRRRAYSRDLSGTTTVTAALAQTIANLYGGQFQNVTNKVKFKLHACRDAYGLPIDLWRLRAGKNIYVPDLAVRGQVLALTPIAGTNQFYIVQTSYYETADDLYVELQCDNYQDDANVQIARLTLALDAQRRATSTTGIVQQSGASEKGACGGDQQHPTAGDFITFASAFKTVMKTVPTSISLTTVASLNVTGGTLAAGTITVYGFVVGWNATASSRSYWYGSYQTNGNCILAVDEVAETFDHHCDGCQKVTHGNPIGNVMHNVSCGQDCITYTCPSCGTSECFNTQLTEDDEGDHHRGQQAQHIRRVQGVLAKHGRGKGKKTKLVGV